MRVRFVLREACARMLMEFKVIGKVLFCVRTQAIEKKISKDSESVEFCCHVIKSTIYVDSNLEVLDVLRFSKCKKRALGI